MCPVSRGTSRALVVALGGQVPEGHPAIPARVWLLPRVDPRVRGQLMLLCELPPAVRALERPLARVHPLVVLPLLVGHELLLAVAAVVPLVPVVAPLVDVADVLAGEGLAADGAEEGALEAVRVGLERVQAGEGRAAVLAFVRSDAGVDGATVVEHGGAAGEELLFL